MPSGRARTFSVTPRLAAGAAAHGRVRGARTGAWLALLLATVLWTASLIAAPYLAAHPDAAGLGVRAAAMVYVLAGAVCHQRPDRSFHAWGVQLPVCARCFGLYLTVPLGLLMGGVSAGWPWRRLRRRPLAARGDNSASHQGRLGARLPAALLLFSAVPTALTVAAEWSGLGQPTDVTRAAAAVPLSAAVGWVVAATIRGHLR